MVCCPLQLESHKEQQRFMSRAKCYKVSMWGRMARTDRPPKRGDPSQVCPTHFVPMVTDASEEIDRSAHAGIWRLQYTQLLAPLSSMGGLLHLSPYRSPLIFQYIVSLGTAA